MMSDSSTCELSAAEHSLAQYIAYHIAWHRGGGKEPPYEPVLVHADFCQAAGFVINLREPTTNRANEPKLLPDGTHYFPIETLLGMDGLAIPDARGDISWSAKDGLTYRFEYSHAPTNEAVPSPSGLTPPDQIGSICEIPDIPSWSGTIAGGLSFSLFGAGGKVDTHSSAVGGRYSSQSILTGEAAFATIDLLLDHPLSFRHDTPALRREFVPSFMLLSWPDSEEYTYQDATIHHRRSRNRILLQDDPKIMVYSGSTRPGTGHGVWVVDEGTGPPSDRMPSIGAEDARGFLSFLVGRNLPFYWRDTFPVQGRVRRLYISFLRPHSPVLGNEQPLPLCHVREAYPQGVEIGYRLPQLFAQFREVREDYNLDFVFSPLWTAFDGFLDDKLAGACVSLERLATAHADYLKNNGAGKPKVEFLSKQQGKALRERLTKAAEDVAAANPIPDDVLTIIKNKIANIHQPPNADKLELIFTHLGLELRDDERQAISNRNRALHGRATLAGLDLAAINEELIRFNILRTLVHKAVLRLIGYEGPYMDYGDNPIDMAYSVKDMTTPAAPFV